MSDIRVFLNERAEEIALLRQNNLLDEWAFIKFAKDRGLAVSSLAPGMIDEFYKKGWLPAEELNEKGEPRFHPFRLYSLSKIIESASLGVSATPPLQALDAVDLAVMLEPVYWPRISHRTTRILTSFETAQVDDDECEARRQQYGDIVKNFVQSLDPKSWGEIHKLMLRDAAWLDENGKLYVLLRLTNWKSREILKGPISGALWIRHIAEVIRRAFEPLHNVTWPEEDQGFETWAIEGRKLTFGFERPLDDGVESRPAVASSFGLFTGSSVRWYVEGETEYFAVLEILPEPSKFGIELVNLRGRLAAESDNMALKLAEWLLEDKAQQRFSIISFDTDVAANVKAIERQESKGSIVGLIARHNPDFEFNNFSLEELISIAAELDEKHGYSGDPVRNADWSGIGRARDFEIRYKAVSARRPRSLKGEEWGRALASYAAKHPNKPDGTERAFWHEIGIAVRGRFANYAYHKEQSKRDRDANNQ